MNTKVNADGNSAAGDGSGSVPPVNDGGTPAVGVESIPDSSGNEGDPGEAFMGLLNDTDDFGDISDDSGESDASDLTGKTPPVQDGKSVPQAPVVADKAKVDPAQPQAQPVTPPPPVQQQPPQPGQPPQGAEGQSQAEAPKPFLAALEENRVALKQNLARQFKLDPATVEKLETNAEEAIPEILADQYLNIMAGMYNLLGNVLPKMIDSHTTSSSVNKQTNDEFFGKFPALQKPEYAETIQAVGQQLRRAQPNLSREQLLDRIGQVVSVMVGVEVSPSLTQQQPTARAKPKGKPFTPAVGSPGAVKQQQNAPVNPWEDAAVAFQTDFGE